MGKFDDPLAMLSDPEPVRSGTKLDKKRTSTKKGQKEFVDPLDSLNKSQTSKATQSSSMRGQYWQRTLRLPPEYQDLTLAVHQDSRAKSIADTERWIYAMGLHAYFVEGKRPTYAPSVAREIELPDFKGI